MTPSKAISLWDKARTVDDIKAEIEQMAETGRTCAAFVAAQFNIPVNRAGNYLRDLVREGTLQKADKQKFSDGWRQMYELASEDQPEQRTLTFVEVKRDYLVQAFFGDGPA